MRLGTGVRAHMPGARRQAFRHAHTRSARCVSTHMCVDTSVYGRMHKLVSYTFSAGIALHSHTRPGHLRTCVRKHEHLSTHAKILARRHASLRASMHVCAARASIRARIRTARALCGNTHACAHLHILRASAQQACADTHVCACSKAFGHEYTQGVRCASTNMFGISDAPANRCIVYNTLGCKRSLKHSARIHTARPVH